MKLKLIALAALLAAGSAQAGMDTFATGNGSLLLNFRLYDNAGTTNPGGDQSVSAAFDLGLDMDSFISLATTPTVGQTWTRTWNLVTGDISGTGITGSQNIASYGTVWADLLNKADTSGMTATGGSVQNRIEFNVIAGDSTGAGILGGQRALSTSSTGTTNFADTANSALFNMMQMDTYLVANNSLAGHAAANGASLVTKGSGNAYFGTINGSQTPGDSWKAFTGEDSTRSVSGAQNFWLLSTSGNDVSAYADEYRFGYDLNGDNDILDAGEYGLWSVNRTAGTATFSVATAAPVPEADTYAFLALGMGLVGLLARRRKAA